MGPNVSDAMPVIVAVGLLSSFAVYVVRRIAVQNALLDIPNERSSHKIPVPRLGGAAFVPVLLLALAVDLVLARREATVQSAFLVGAGLLYAISLLDDIRPLSTRLRLVVQFFIAAAIVWAISSVLPERATTERAFLRTNGPWHPAFWLWTCWIVAMLNFYNFMDGIDGIAGTQAIVAGGLWGLLGMATGAPFVSLVGSCACAAALGFLVFNWPPAKIFMGDAGSTVLGYIFAVLPLLATIEAKAEIGWLKWFGAGILVLWPFWSDGIFTLIRRLRQGENIFQAHRSHLYQRLVIAGRTHRRITLVYGVLALTGAVLAWSVVRDFSYAPITAVFVVLGLFGALWQWTVREERRLVER